MKISELIQSGIIDFANLINIPVELSKIGVAIDAYGLKVMGTNEVIKNLSNSDISNAFRKYLEYGTDMKKFDAEEISAIKFVLTDGINEVKGDMFIEACKEYSYYIMKHERDYLLIFKVSDWDTFKISFKGVAEYTFNEVMESKNAVD